MNICTYLCSYLRHYS